MFFVCHSKLKWKQDCVWCQQKRMANADVQVFYSKRTTASSRGNVRKSPQFLVWIQRQPHGTEWEMFRCTRYSIFFYCFMSNVLSVELMHNRCRINLWRLMLLLYTKILHKHIQRDLYSGFNCFHFHFPSTTQPQVSDSSHWAGRESFLSAGVTCKPNGPD